MGTAGLLTDAEIVEDLEGLGQPSGVTMGTRRHLGTFLDNRVRIRSIVILPITL